MAKLAVKIRTVLIDLSGTLHIESTTIPGCVEGLQRLREKQLNVKFVTNTTKESKRYLLERLRGMGFNIGGEEIFTSLTAARQLVDSRGLHPLLMLEDAAMEDFQGIPAENPNAVVVGLAPSMFDYDTMTKAFRLLLAGAPLIAIHKSRYYQTSSGPSLGPGPFVTGLEYAADVKAEVVGKPEKCFFLSSISEFDCKPEEAVMIGDDVRDDVGGAQNAGLIGILVKTGKYRDGDENKISPAPNYVVDDFQAAVQVIIDKLL